MTIPPLPKSRLLGSLTEYGSSIFDPLKADYVRSCFVPWCITLIPFEFIIAACISKYSSIFFIKNTRCSSDYTCLPTRKEGFSVPSSMVHWPSASPETILYSVIINNLWLSTKSYTALSNTNGINIYMIFLLTPLAMICRPLCGLRHDHRC